DKDNNEIDLKQNFDEDDNMGLVPADTPIYDEKSVEVGSELEDGFGIENVEDLDELDFPADEEPDFLSDDLLEDDSDVFPIIEE
ncbi:MAG: hypothetical protein RR528_07375, partial [Angelakisella sp.]